MFVIPERHDRLRVTIDGKARTLVVESVAPVVYHSKVFSCDVTDIGSGERFNIEVSGGTTESAADWYPLSIGGPWRNKA